MKVRLKDDLIKHFENGCKKDLLIGVENEKFLFDLKTNKRANYDQIKNILIFLKKFGWNEINEDSNIIGLTKNGQSITLEPGNQIELAGGLCKNIHEVCGESFTFQEQLDKANEKYGLKTLSIGYDPVTDLNNVPNNPKKRYNIMSEEMPKDGELSLHMMYQTCGTQINLDYSSESNFKKKFKVISFLTPLTIALFANSALKNNKPSGFLSYRSKVWQSTSRGGLPEIFLEDMTFEKYCDFALNFPLLFIYKNNKYLPPNGKRLLDIANEDTTNLDDLKLHLSTIFTELRLKSYIELRSIDACEWDCHCAAPAFFTGIIYENLDEIYDLIKNWKINDILNAYSGSHTKGLKTEIDSKSILYWSKIIFEIARDGLKKRNFINKKGNDETVYLKNVENILINGRTKAEDALKNYK